MSKKLLLADDSVTIQKVVELVLADEDFEIRTASDGEEAMEIIRDFRPDIVLADIEMPKLNGYQLCERLKNDESTKDIPVVLLAGAFEPIDEELYQDVHADDYLIKPFESEELISKINALIAEKEIPSEEPQEEEVAEQEQPSEEALVVEEVSSEEEPIEVAEAVAVTETEDIEEIAEPVEAEAVEEVAETVEKALPEEDREAEEMAEELGEDLSFAEELGAEEAESVAEEVTEVAKESMTEEPGENLTEEKPPSVEELKEPVSEEPAPSEKPLPSETEAPSFELSLPSKEELMASIEAKLNEQLSQLVGSVSVDEGLVRSAIESSLSERLSEVTGALSTEDIKESIREILDERITSELGRLIQGIDLKGALEEKIDALLRDDLKRILEEIAPEIVENTVKKAIEEMSESLKQRIENVVWETVPDLAETIITREIEKIKSSF